MRKCGIKSRHCIYKKSCKEVVTEEQAGSLNRYKLGMIFFILVSLVMVRHCVVEAMA